jgi:hypothetical protein
MARLSRSWRTWRALSWAQRRLLARAWLLLPPVVVRLRLSGFRRAQAALLGRTAAPGDGDLPAAQATARLVLSAARWSPVPASCLPRALVLARLLRDQGLAAELRIGVARADGRFAAHAWVEHGGVPLADRQDVALHYAPFERAWLIEEGTAP